MCGRRANTGPDAGAAVAASGNAVNRVRRSASHASAHSAAVPCTMKFRVKRPRSREARLARRMSAVDASASLARACVARHVAPASGVVRPHDVETGAPSSPRRAAASTIAIARGYVRRNLGTSRPLSPVVAPYIAPSMATFASSRVATAPSATMPS